MDAQGGPTTIIATMSRVDRATKKALRERERKERSTARRSAAPELAARYAALFEQMTRAHCVKYERRDWVKIAEVGPVEPAVRAHALEKKARRALANYRPGIIDGLFGLQQDRRRALAAKVLEAAKKDAELYGMARRNADLHNLDISLAAAMTALDYGAIETALQAHLPIPALQPILEGLAVAMPGPGRLVVHIDMLELDALPDESVELNDAGRSVHALITPTARHELQLAYVCSAALRVGLEVMTVVPIDRIDILVRCFLPAAKARGEAEQYPIAHLRLTHEQLKAMDLRRMEPVSTFTALGGRLDWDVGRGFAPIAIEDLKLSGPAAPPERLAAPA
ncbi:hypothetical protein [Phenylobacterium sp.]|uniref:hypothetical protein n=1 Tax=Phenylobacterium sp. TaxID=1871053 RepID=UPI00289DD217|nr:hypothetical protein [Phenylobacterium sp.]